MSNTGPPLLLALEVCSQVPISPDQIENEILELRDEIRDLRVESVALTSGDHNRPGAKGDAITFGSLVIAVVPELVTEVVKLAFDWIKRDPTRTIKIRQKATGREYEITGAWNPSQLAEIMEVLAKQQ